ncbi:MAG TPA: hypothetical protein ACFE0H_04555 [Elainellaceae cyanobacterium]|jgi:hypothetical protein
MTPDKAAQLQSHLDAIAELLYEESDPAAMQTLEGIELTVREKIQAHVAPELGRFLSAQLAARRQDERER